MQENGNRLLHLDRRGEIILVLHKKRSITEKYKWETVRQDWLPGNIRKLYGNYFQTVPFFEIDIDTFNDACRIIDKYILETYPPDVLEQYEKHDIMPQDFVENVPMMLKPFWDILIRVNQNKRCMYKVLKRPIEGHEGIDVRLWSGHKVITPFTSDMDNYYNTMRVIGSPNEIDRFIRKFKP